MRGSRIKRGSDGSSGFDIDAWFAEMKAGG
jgi:hypothetical protein